MSWIKKLKVGDEVAMSRGFACTLTVYKVKRLTKTMLALDNTELRFNLNSGDCVGEHRWRGWHPPVLVELTQDVRNDIRKKKLIKAISSTEWNGLKLSSLEHILMTIKEEV